ncbi:type II toxin-antitoxin system RelE/ParE family toxin [Agrobacterium sp. AGB01]|uniref:type II toxin-antitoxin system RelE/ParE family toxin n=1 Tax=Agrobacterium sp. AGB01 TaxID=2769302 RepID=UPI0035304D28
MFTYIELDNPAAAVLIDERIVAASRRLLDFPASGRLGRIAGTLELDINSTPYVAAYTITEMTVRIFRVLHGGARMARVSASKLDKSCARPTVLLPSRATGLWSPL